MSRSPILRSPRWMPRIPRIAALAALILVCGLLWSMPALASPIAANEIVRTLRLGSEGTRVETIQTQLKSLGYFQGEVSGIYDQSTQIAVEAFQKDRNLKADGVAGTETQRQLLDTEEISGPLRTEMPPDIQRILDRGRLVVALLGTDNPPFFLQDSSSIAPTGLDIKMAWGLADALGVDLEFNRSAETFNEVVEQVYQLKADIAISKLSQTLSRAKRVRFSRPYVSMRQGLLVNRLQLAQQTQGNRVVEAIRNFDGKMGVIQGSSYVGFLKQKFPNATIEEYPAWEDIVSAVTRGDIQAAYRDELEVKKVILRNPDAALRLQTIALTDTQDQIAMALPWDSSHFQAFVNQYLDTLNLNYTADLVLDEYADQIETASSDT